MTSHIGTGTNPNPTGKIKIHHSRLFRQTASFWRTQRSTESSCHQSSDLWQWSRCCHLATVHHVWTGGSADNTAGQCEKTPSDEISCLRDRNTGLVPLVSTLGKWEGEICQQPAGMRSPSHELSVFLTLLHRAKHLTKTVHGVWRSVWKLNMQ